MELRPKQENTKTITRAGRSHANRYEYGHAAAGIELNHVGRHREPVALVLAGSHRHDRARLVLLEAMLELHANRTLRDRFVGNRADVDVELQKRTPKHK